MRIKWTVLTTSLILSLTSIRVYAALPACPAFQKFPAQSLFLGPYKAPNLHQTKRTWLYRTQLRDAVTGEPTFAGHFVIADWGCGTECQSFAAIDRRSGSVFMFEATVTYDIDYRFDSRMILIDSPIKIQEIFKDEPMPPEGKNSFESYDTMYTVYDEKADKFSKLVKCHQDLPKS